MQLSSAGKFLAGVGLLAISLGGGAQAQSGPRIDAELFADLRLGFADAEPTWLDDWFGKARFGGNRDGDTRADLEIAQIAALIDIEFDWEWSAFVHAKYDEIQDGPIDLVEAYVKYDPTPTSSTRYSFRAGLFFPHISRENVGTAWSSPYTITPSAINSWVGEEIRTFGLEGKVSFRGETSQLDVTAAIFGFNDPAGTLLAFRGWALNDVVGGAFSRLPLPQLPQIGPNGTFVTQDFFVEPVAEIDDKVGFYAAVDYTYDRNWKLGAFYYDNRGDPNVRVGGQYAWDTKFWNFYAEGDVFQDVHVIAQYMTGSTEMGRITGAGTRYIDIDYEAAFVLATHKFGNQRISGRFDWFQIDDFAFIQRDNNNEAGIALTAAYSVELGNRDTLIAEYLYIDSKRPARRTLGFDAEQRQNVFQIAYRRRF